MLRIAGLEVKIHSWEEAFELIRASDFLFEEDVVGYRFYHIRDSLHASNYYLYLAQAYVADGCHIIFKENRHSKFIIYSYWDLSEVSFEEVLANLPEHLQIKLLFHLDLFV